METTIVYRGYIGIMEKKMETTTVYLDDMGNNKEEVRNYYSSYVGILGTLFKSPLNPSMTGRNPCNTKA